MTKTISLFILTLFISIFSYGQEELKLYKNIYRTSDSLKLIGHIKDIDSTIFKTANKLDKQHPLKFFETSGELLLKAKFNEASFIYYLGLMRFRYYNSVNPDYQPSGDGALFGSLKYTMDEPVNMYLRTDIDNFISIIKMTIDYYGKNDFTFYTNQKDIEKFNLQTKSYLDLVTELETNKTQYSEQWDAERKTMEKNIEELIIHYNETEKDNSKDKKKKGK